MFDDGPTDKSNVVTRFQGLAPNGGPCLLEMSVTGIGLCNAPTTFTRLLTHVLDPFIYLFVIVYLDDICIYSKSAEEYLEYLRNVLIALRENNYLLKWSSFFRLNEKPSTLVSSKEVAMFEHPNQRLQH